jgi:hypothetical protein
LLCDTIPPLHCKADVVSFQLQQQHQPLLQML